MCFILAYTLHFSYTLKYILLKVTVASKLGISSLLLLYTFPIFCWGSSSFTFPSFEPSSYLIFLNFYCFEADISCISTFFLDFLQFLVFRVYFLEIHCSIQIMCFILTKTLHFSYNLLRLKFYYISIFWAFFLSYFP